MKSMNSLDDSKTARESDLTHTSTWMFILDKPDFAASLLPKVGKDSLPMILKLTHAGKDSEKHVYSNMTV